jgi:hypothetical protein
LLSVLLWPAGYQTLKTATCASPFLNAADAVPVIRSSMHSCLKHLLAPPALPPWLHPRKTFPAHPSRCCRPEYSLWPRASPSLDSQPHAQPRSALLMGCSLPRHHSTSLSARGSRSSQSATPTTTTTTGTPLLITDRHTRSHTTLLPSSSRNRSPLSRSIPEIGSRGSTAANSRETMCEVSIFPILHDPRTHTAAAEASAALSQPHCLLFCRAPCFVIILPHACLCSPAAHTHIVSASPLPTHTLSLLPRVSLAAHPHLVSSPSLVSRCPPSPCLFSLACLSLPTLTLSLLPRLSLAAHPHLVVASHSLPLIGACILHKRPGVDLVPFCCSARCSHSLSAQQALTCASLVLVDLSFFSPHTC